MASFSILEERSWLLDYILESCRLNIFINSSINRRGFIAPLVAGIASAVLPSLASFIMDKISGKGIFMKRGGSIIKMKQMGEGLYLRPYKADNITGDGLYIKNGGSYELIKDGSIKDIPLLNIL